MRRLFLVLPLVAVLFACALPAAASVRRFAIVAGANRGGDDRPVLKYAVNDATRFAAVMQELGGVEAGDAVVLRQPRVGELEASMVAIGDRVRAIRRTAAATPGEAVRTEVFLYYSGHADEKGLLLGNDRISYETLRDRLDAIPADVRIAVLDACASGAITRMKGGRRKGAFDVDGSSSMRGQAFVTSSSANESAQESDRIGGSYFTHYLISGLRGAADASADGRVTLHEAYQFAFHETLSRTVGTRGGAQHPAYEIELSGTGDMVLTDLRTTSAGLVLGETMDGRFFIRDAHKQLVLECYKPLGRRVEVGLEPGAYDIHLERTGGSMRASFEVKDGGRLALDPDRFVPATLEATRVRGGGWVESASLQGRHRLELRLHPPQTGDLSEVGPAGVSNAEWTVTPVGIQYARFVRENLAVGVALEVLSREMFFESASDQISHQRNEVSLPVVVEWNPLGPNRARRAVRPYVFAGIGPVVTTIDSSTIGVARLASETSSGVSVVGVVGGRVDWGLGRSWAVGITAAWSRSGASDDEFTPLARRRVFQVGISVGWLFGSSASQGR